MELYPQNLSQLLATVDLNPELQKSLARDVISGLMYLHSIPIVHRDIKSNNILVTKDLTARIADFGTSNFMSTSAASRLVGTPFYLAPECVKELKYSAESDLYALAITLWEIFENNPKPFYHIKEFYPLTNVYSILMAIHEKKLRPIFTKKTASVPEVVKLITTLWAENSQNRSTLADALVVIEGSP